MEFKEKLKQVRKEHNITQEELAEKLGVSRQAVSKWESGGAYPDTDKLIQICKMFDTSLDELIGNSEVSNKNESKKITFMEAINEVIDFFQKSFAMFWSMKFIEKIKLIFEMAILILILCGVAIISSNIITGILYRILIFLPGNVLRTIMNIFDSLLYIAWIILGIMIVIKVFRTRYLDYYVVITDKNIDKTRVEEPIQELKEKEEYKVVIRDPKHSSFNFLKTVWKIFIFLFKAIVLFVAIPLVIAFISLVAVATVSLLFVIYGMFFAGISLGTIGACLFLFILVWFIFNLIFDRKQDYKKIFMLFILSILCFGIGIGLAFYDMQSFTIIENFCEKANKTITIEMKDDLVLPSIIDLKDDQIVIDNDLDIIKFDLSTCAESKIYTHTYEVYNHNKVYSMTMFFDDYDGFTIFKDVINSLKKKELKEYNYGYDIEKVYISRDNLTKLKDNYVNYYDE
jgi:transcriptional regulator with XRE-family HTH domain